MKVKWSPTISDQFVTSSSNIIRLHQIIQNGSNEIEGTQISAENRALLLSKMTCDLSPIKCFDWYPGTSPSHLIAIGLNTGKIYLQSFQFNQADEEDMPSVREFGPRSSCPCQQLSFNPAHHSWVAAAYDRRTDRTRTENSSLLVWDIRSAHTVGNTASSSQHDKRSSTAGLMKQVFESGAGAADCCLSCSWIVNETRTIAASFFNRTQIKVFDLRQDPNRGQAVQTKSLNGLTSDPLRPVRLASFHDNEVNIWDLRSFNKPCHTIREGKHVVDIQWCPTRANLLSVALTGNSLVTLHDLNQPSSNTADESEPTIISRAVPGCASHTAVTSIAWHPTIENKMLILGNNEELSEVTNCERISLAWSSKRGIAFATGKKVALMEPSKLGEVLSALDEIGDVMRRRAELGYGARPFTSVKENEEFLRLVSNEVKSMWEFLSLQESFSEAHRVSSLGSPSITPTAPPSILYTGVKYILRGETSGRSTCEKSRALKQPWLGCDSRSSDIFTEHSQWLVSGERTQVLKHCGWGESRESEEFTELLSRLEKEGQYERSAALALFSLMLDKAIDILHRGAVKDPTLSIIATALAGFHPSHSSSLWKANGQRLTSQLNHPYLKAMFIFLSSIQQLSSILLVLELAVADKVALACRFLDDGEIIDFLDKLSAKLIGQGCLEGLILTGLAGDGLDLLQGYLDRSDDLQTVACVVAIGRNHPLMKDDSRVQRWIESYRELLDQWQKWEQRSLFDIHASQLDSTSALLSSTAGALPAVLSSQVDLLCEFCKNSLSPSLQSLRMTHGRARPPTRGLDAKNLKAIPRVSSCSSCRKPLPKCAVCDLFLGTNAKFVHGSFAGNNIPSEFDDWFTWCQTCHHGGHSFHLLDWFKDHQECPSISCSCRCMTLDV